MRISGWIVGAAIGAIAAAAAVVGAWQYLILGVVGAAFAAFALAHPRATLLLWILIAPWANAYATIALPAGLPDITFGRVVIVLVLAALLLRVRVVGSPMRFGVVEVAMLAVVAVAIVDLMLRGSDAGSAGLQIFDQYLAPALFFIAARNLGFASADLRRVASVLAAAGVCLAAHGVYQYLTVTPESLQGLDPAAVEQLGEHLTEGRAVGPLANAVEYGGVVAIAFMAALLVALPAAGGVQRLVPLAALMPIGVAVAVTLTRSVWLGWLLAFWTAAIVDRERRAAIVLATGALTVAVLAAALVLPDESAFAERAVASEPVSGRLSMYRVAAQMIARQPLIGYGRGLGTYEAARKEALALGGSEEGAWAPGQFHNVYVSALVEWGILGLTAQLAWQFLFFAAALALRRRPTPAGGLAYRFAGFFVAASVVYFVQGLFVDMAAFLYLPQLYFLLAGLVFAELDAVTSREAGAERAVTSSSAGA